MENSSARMYRIVTGIVLVVGLCAALAWYFTRPAQPDASTLDLSTTTPSTATSTADGLGTSGGGYTVSTDNTVELPTPPDFRQPVSYAAGISSDVRAIIEKHVAELQAKLAGNSYDLGAWIDLGTYHKMGGDYKGAETAWLFVTQAAPGNSIAFANLGDLYMNFLKDYPKADTMYKKEIALQPDAVDAYISLALMYENFYPAGGSAEVILKKGVAANVNSIELELALARYYVRTGNAAAAKTAYQVAVSIAEKAGNTDLVSQIKAEGGL